MSRPKSAYLKELAERAEADLKAADPGRVSSKLQAVIAAAAHPVAAVAGVMGVAKQTVLRWAKEYRDGGVEALRPKAKRPKPSKLSQAQKAAVHSWLEDGKTAGGKDVHWTLGRLRHEIEREFGITLGTNTIWVWLRKEGWRPKVPRPRRCKADRQAQEEFKKKPPN